MDNGSTTFRHNPDPALLASYCSRFDTVMPISLPLQYALEFDTKQIPPQEYVPLILISILSAFYKATCFQPVLPFCYLEVSSPPFFLLQR
jgi:hypothetical protein